MENQAVVSTDIDFNPKTGSGHFAVEIKLPSEMCLNNSVISYSSVTSYLQNPKKWAAQASKQIKAAIGSNRKIECTLRDWEETDKPETILVKGYFYQVELLTKERKAEIATIKEGLAYAERLPNAFVVDTATGKPYQMMHKGYELQYKSEEDFATYLCCDTKGALHLCVYGHDTDCDGTRRYYDFIKLTKEVINENVTLWTKTDGITPIEVEYGIDFNPIHLQKHLFNTFSNSPEYNATEGFTR